MNASNPWLARGGRLIVGFVTLAAVGALGVGAVMFEPPLPQASVPTYEAQPSAATTRLVCGDSYVVGGRDAADASKILTAGAFTLAKHGSDAAGADTQQLPMLITDTAAATALSVTSDDVVDLTGTGDIHLAAEDATGYAASACRAPLTESWILGVSTDVGSTGVLTLANPGQVAATVTITVYGIAGPSVAPGGSNVVVQPGEVVALPVASLVGTEPAPVLNLRSAGTPIVASVQSTMVRGLTPTGIDVVAASSAPSQTQVIPGIRVQQQLVGTITTSVRMLATESAAKATVTITPVGSKTPVSVIPVELEAGIPLVIPVEDLAPGEYTAIVSADAPVLATVWQAGGVRAGSDYAWHSAAPELTGEASASIAAGEPATLYLTNTAASPVPVTVSGDEITVPGGETVAVPVKAGAMTLDAPTPIHASVTYASTSALAALPVLSPSAMAGVVVITR